MIPFVLVLLLFSPICGKEENDILRTEYASFDASVSMKRQVSTKGSVIRMFCEIHNSTAELKGISLETPEGCLMFEIRAGSFLKAEDCLLMKKSSFGTHYICNEGACEMANTSLRIEKDSDCGLMEGVVKLLSEGSSLLVKNSEWKNVAFGGSGSILRNGEGSYEGIKNCVFTNITVKNDRTDELLIEKTGRMRRSELEDCFVERSMNVLEGEIVSGTQGSVFFWCNNCTFLQNERTDRRMRNTERNSTTETQSFMNAEWNGCSAECGGALYVHDNPDATLTVLNSSFAKCNATSTRGGGIFALNIAECTIKHSTFVECYCAASNHYGGGGAQFQIITNQMLINDCLFADDWSEDDGGGLAIDSIKTTKSKDCVLDSSFYNCSGHDTRSTEGGAFLNWGPVDKVVTRNCLFHRCSSDFRGGGIGINASNYYGDLLWFCFFHDNTAPYASDVYISDILSISQLSWCYSTGADESRCYAGGNKGEWLPNNGGKCRFVGPAQIQTNAKDTFSCGLNESCACLTISHCMSQLIVGFVEEMKVVAGTVVEEKGVNIGEKTISVKGASSSGSAIETKFGANELSLFYVGTGVLSMSDLSVVHNTSLENSRQCRLFEIEGDGGINLERLNISMDTSHSEERRIQNSLVKMDGGELKMQGVRWGRTFGTTNMFSLPQGSSVSLSLDGCVFSNIVRTTAGPSMMCVGEGSHSITLEGCTFDGCGSEESEFGGGLMAEIGNGGSLTMNRGVVQNCYASITQGRGGGIGLKVKDTSADFLISSSFEGNRAKWGSDIFADSIDLELTAKSGKITCLTASFETRSKIQGFDKGNESTPIPLCAYLIPLPDEIIVSNADAFDNFYCGYAEIPCMTLKHSLTRQEEEKKIVVSGLIEVKNELTFDSFKHTIRGQDENSGWKVIDECDGSGESMIAVRTNAILKSLTFSVPSILPNHEAFFSSSSQLFSLEDCSLSFQNSQSVLSYVFLSVSAGKVSVSSFVVLSLTIGNFPLICLDGSNVDGTFASMSIEDICRETKSVLFGVVNGASLTIQDSTLSVKASTQADSSSAGSIRVISTKGAKLMKLTNNTMSGFKGIGENGGAMECTLESYCTLEIVGGTMSGCESKGGDGGGLWVEMEEGSAFTVGNMTEADSAKTTSSNVESGLLQFASCKATQSADGKCGHGGGIYLHLADGASSFTLKDVSFFGCDAREGKDIFINADDLSGVIDRESISFGADLNELTKLNGFERLGLNEAFAIPLVLYLWNNFSAPAFVGGSSSHDFSMCGFETFPCSTIAKAASVHFEGKKKDVALLEPFVFEEELTLTGNEWSVKGKENEMKCDVCDRIPGTQSGLIENTIPTSVAGLVFCLTESLSFHESVFECHSGKLTLNKCGMEGGSEGISTVFVKAVGGVVEVIEFSTKNLKIGDSSFFIVEGSAESVPSINMTKSVFGEISLGNGCVVECRNGNIEKITGCTFSSITRSKGSGGCISIRNEDDGSDYEVEMLNCNFEDCAVIGEEEERGGGGFFYESSGNTNLLMSRCEFYCCTAPYEEEIVGYGGGIMMKMLRDEEADFVISSPLFSSEKPNNAKFGKDLFISSPSLVKSIKNETLPFVKDRLDLVTEDSMRGFDGGNRECAIPLIYFWRKIGSSVHIARGGNNVVVCGLLEYPCASVDYGVKRGRNLGVESIAVQGVCDVRSEMRMSGMKLEGANGDRDRIEFVRAVEGEGDCVVECKGVVQFEEVGMVIPTAFGNGAGTLMETGADAVKTSVVSCAIHMKDDAEGMLSFVLISASKGIVEIEETKIAGLASRHEILRISTGCVVSMSETIFEDIALSGISALTMSESEISGNGNGNGEEEWNILFEKCTFANVKQNELNNPSLICCNANDEVKVKMENSTTDGCGSESSHEGGGVFFVLNERGRLEMNHTNVTDCFCSNTGRGGGLFLKSQSVSLKALPFVLSNITFRKNVALKGRDVFVKCTDLDSQISESQFLINFGEPFVKELAIWGCTAENYGDEEDLLGRVFVFRSEFIFVSSIVGNSSNSKNCGEMKGMCSSLDVGVSHIIPSDYSQLYVWNETRLSGSCSAQKVTIKSMEGSRSAEIKVCEIEVAGEDGITSSEYVRVEKVSFVFGGMENVVCSSLIHQLNGHLILESVSFLSESRTTENSRTSFDSSLLVVEDGIFEAEKCIVSCLEFSKPVFRVLSSERATFEDLTIGNAKFTSSVIECGSSQNMSVLRLEATSITLQDRSLISFENHQPSLTVSFVQSLFANISRTSCESCIICGARSMGCLEMHNCSFHECTSSSVKGSQVGISSNENVLIDSCVFEGSLLVGVKEMKGIFDEICKWNGSVVDLSKSEAVVRDTTICNSSKGGLTMSGGSLMIEKGELSNNNPFIEKFPSLRRNIICSDSASLTISSLKGGDGALPNTSIWMLDDGCTVGGIISERDSPFFIPVLESVEAREEGAEVDVVFKGKLLLPCNLSFMVVKQMGDEKQIEKYEFDEIGHVSETEANGRLRKETIREAEDEAEVRVCILFGGSDDLSSTDSFILKNKSETKLKGNERIAENGNEKKSWWVVVVISCLIFLILLSIIVVLAVRWRKAKNENKDLREIVNDTVRKDPKLIEMVTMEMSPEEQWRKAEREAEKKNEERIKKRIYETNMQHSESSEHLLSESGSTEYILGRDSDKIPEWVLEKVEEEDIRKRTPSPSTSSTDTSDTESSFVRREDLCPTTSSMSNLVDAMACSSPHEKLIVDLRDSLFMLLHGKNKTKEMPIGSLKEREQTAAQILFWVANLALHSFDEMDNPLSSLANLSPHIVLFSEHMVICIVMHSDFLSSDDDSDSSSISSLTVVSSSSSNISVMSERFTDSPPPSSAFEEDDDIRKECLRWKAPELLMNKKMGATKESVAFSIGMMLWECLTLEIPFGEYDGDGAGQKIKNGERPNMKHAEGSELCDVARGCLSSEESERPLLVDLKKVFVQHLPKDAFIFTIADALFTENANNARSGAESETESETEGWTTEPATIRDR
ncbi:uncharacterized protein MONOS_5039 [Monocercomonoides exilis]|uniref:uncharacterized protein n=1 Tax=Monocercomonoides exilis TaxID=2049356 RepID=UPI00355A060A|nr:hypothetical protein MONOS_5039 [Monocercomonoides exilis]|eukprot:MONOS_5039.1-p1 / transcript=MONOS_5039.1 / gene=MONOS_5039 / organism=Monocercomonoides_exilis_PA203 / gene_product=unspecified product / transcript_product=unspecified product / location=Mono_scaffold00142:59758-68781(-) / protein_length=3007 / sequence_SO=supercontig / SO=protein_coding / is_pseudo=false